MSLGSILCPARRLLASSALPAVFPAVSIEGRRYIDGGALDNVPITRAVEHGHVLNMDFGVKVDGYVSDMQRTFYVLDQGETAAPPEASSTR